MVKSATRLKRPWMSSRFAHTCRVLDESRANRCRSYLSTCSLRLLSRRVQWIICLFGRSSSLKTNGIGETRIQRVVDLALEERIRYSDAIELARAEPERFRTLAPLVRAADDIIERARRMTSQERESFDEWLTRVAEELRTPAPVFSRLIELTRDVAEPVAELELVDTGGDDETRDEAASQGNFVSELVATLMNVSDAIPPFLEDVTFTSMHGKGLNADAVIVLQAEDEVIPGEADAAGVDEARRLLYVSITRARKLLVVAACQKRTGPQRYVGSQEVPSRTLTRFLTDYGLPGRTAGELIRVLTEYDPA